MAARRSSALAASLAFALAACVGPSTPAEDARGDDANITVASFNFPESVLLAEIYAQAIEGAGIRVEREPSLGPRELVMPALLQGLVEFVPEYAGSGLQFLAGDGWTSPDHEINHQRFADRLGTLDVTALDASPAEDQNGFAVTAETAQRYGLRTLSDLATVSRELVFGGPPECTRRPFCIPGLERSYGITFGQVFSNLDTGGPRTVSALAEGTVDVALLFTSDGAIDLNDFVLLEDDLDLQPAENVTPVIRTGVLDRFGPSLADTVNAVSALLSTGELRTLNAEVARGATQQQIASRWLASNGLEPGLQ
jgi:osmoprotectant transport system substrate-binding protein